MRRALLAMLLASLPAIAAGQAIVVSPKPDKVAVTVYRAPFGGEMNLSWLNGFAMVSETRRVAIPAGTSELRFEGVAGGLVPQSAVVSLPGGALLEKNRDAKLLSPGTLLDAYLGRRVYLRRTSQATGAVREQEAVILASGEGVVLQTETGFEALRCTGLDETLLPPQVPAALPAKPTLSVQLRSGQPVEGEVTLTYLSSDFDWRAHYVATLSPDEKSLNLFAWLTLANGDETGFANADAMAVAGRLNREETERLQPEMRPIYLTCWPSQRTHEIPLDQPPPPPPPPPPPAVSESIVVTGSRLARQLDAASPVTVISAEQEDLGDLKLYRIPIPVTVGSNSQKQVALLDQPKARVENFYRWRASFDSGSDEPQAAERVLRLDNRERDGLGLPLPAGSFTLFTMRDGQPFLLGEGQMTDRAVGEKVEVPLSPAPGVRVLHRALDSKGGREFEFELTATNDQPRPVRFEAQLQDGGIVLRSNEKVVRRDGAWWWTTTLPANGSRTLRVRYRNP